MLHVEQGYRSATRRVGIYDQLEKALRRHAFPSEEAALAFSKERAAKLGAGYQVREPDGYYEVEPVKVGVDEGGL